MEIFGFVYYKCQCILNYVYLFLYSVLFNWTLHFASCCVGIGSLIFSIVHWTYDDWILSFTRYSYDFF